MKEPVYDPAKVVKLQYWVETAVAVPMIAAVFLYGLAVFFSKPSEEGCGESFETLIYCLVAIELAAGFILKRMILGTPKLLQASELGAAALRKICAKRFKALMTALACSEAAALHGLILAFSGCGIFHFYLLAAVSLAALAWHFPRRRSLEAYIGAHIASHPLSGKGKP